MPNIVCPDCHASVEFAESAPTSCPQCGASLRASGFGIAAGRPPEGGRLIREGEPRYGDGDVDDVSLRPNRWRTTVLGVQFMFWSMLGVLVLGTLVQIMQVVSPIDPNNPAQQLSPTAMLAAGAGCIMFIALILFLVGIIMCCFAPDSAAFRSALTSIISLGVSIVLMIILFAVVFMNIMPQIQQHAQQQPQQPMNQQQIFAAALAGAGPGLYVLAGVTFAVLLLFYFSWLYFHVAVANAFNDRSLRRLGIINLVAWPFFILVGASANFLPSETFGVRNAFTWLRVQAAVGLAVNLIEYTLYLILAWNTIKTIEAGTAGGRD